MADDALRRDPATEGSPPERADALAAALDRLLGSEPEEHALRRLVGALADAVPDASCAMLLAPDPDDPGRLAILAAVGLDEGAPEWVTDGFVLEALRAPAPIRATAPGPPFPAGTRAAAAAPLGGGTGGVLAIGTRGADRVAADALVLLRVAAERAARTLERARLARARDAAVEEARRAREETTSRRTAVDFILGIVGHDLRNPLGAVHMSAALLQKRGGLEGWQARTVERMRSSAGRMGRIIADLLSYTRTRLGNGIPIDRRPCRLDDLVRRVVDELRAGNADREISVEVRGDVSGEWDPDRLEQVASNLVSNAIDHGDPGTPIRVEVAEDGGGCLLRVVNSGPPVPPDVRAHLFEPFSRPPDEKSRKGSGLGLGLYISREIVRGHGGDIGIDSDGETAITVLLPRRA
jgi:signal transduction histidine kinase